MKQLFFITTLILSSFRMGAQNSSAHPLPKWAIIANFGHQEAGLDLSFGSLQVIHEVPIRPHIGVGIERTWVNRNRFRLFQDLQASYYHDTYVEKGYGLSTDLGFEFKIFKGLRLTPRLGVGYNLAKATDVRYKYEGEKWVRAENTDPSVSRINIKAGLDLSYRFHQRFDVIIGGHYAAVSPYIADAVSLYLFKGVHIGGRYFF